MDDDSRSLIPLSDGSLSTTSSGQSRILSSMVADTLSLAEKEQYAPPALEFVGDKSFCLRNLCRAFRERCPPLDKSSLPFELDDLSLACLLLAVECDSDSCESALVELAACLDKVAGRSWFNTLPWRLALGICEQNLNPKLSPEPDQDLPGIAWPRQCPEPYLEMPSLEQLTVNLDHHNSSLRLWMLEIAWCVRDRLNPVEATVRLLKNVADTIAYWDSSLGLCRAIYPTNDAFWTMVDSFKPKDFASQYQLRVVTAREKGLTIFQDHLERMEQRVRGLIRQAALGAPPPESKNSEATQSQ